VDRELTTSIDEISVVSTGGLENLQYFTGVRETI
jgi:hypothetical protein